MIASQIVSRSSTPVVLVASVLWVLATAPVASASCAEPPPLGKALESAQLVFVGTVTALDHDGRTATFRVEDVWKGSVGQTVVVNGGPPLAELEKAEREGYGVASSVDRTYEAGARYLVVPVRESGDVLSDNACSSTQVYTSKLDRFRPASAPLPTPEPPPATPAPTDRPADGGGGWPAIALIVAAIAIAGSAAWFGAKWRRTPSAR